MANQSQIGPFYRQWGTATASGAVNPHVIVYLDNGAGAPYTSTLAAGDVKVSKDGGAVANVTSLPTQIGTTGLWILTLTATEMQAYTVTVIVNKAGISLTVINIETTMSLGRQIVDATNIGSNTNAIQAQGVGTGVGISAIGGATGNGVTLKGGATSGHGMQATTQAGNSSGLKADGFGTGYGIQSTHNSDNSLMNNILDCLEGTITVAAVASNATFRSILGHLKRRFFNKVTQTSSTQIVYADDSATALDTMSCSADGTTATKSKSV